MHAGIVSGAGIQISSDCDWFRICCQFIGYIFCSERAKRFVIFMNMHALSICKYHAPLKYVTEDICRFMIVIIPLPNLFHTE